MFSPLQGNMFHIKHLPGPWGDTYFFCCQKIKMVTFPKCSKKQLNIHLKDLQAKHFWLMFFFIYNTLYGFVFIHGWEKKPGGGFLNLPLFQKWLVTQTVWPIVAAGQHFEVFAERSWSFIERLSNKYFLIMLP